MQSFLTDIFIQHSVDARGRQRNGNLKETRRSCIWSVVVWLDLWNVGATGIQSTLTFRSVSNINFFYLLFCDRSNLLRWCSVCVQCLALGLRKLFRERQEDIIVGEAPRSPFHSVWLSLHLTVIPFDYLFSLMYDPVSVPGCNPTKCWKVQPGVTPAGTRRSLKMWVL